MGEETEMGETVQVDDASTRLGTDFSYIVYDDTGPSQEKMRWIKVQCPGAGHGDVTADVVFNVCVVTVKRPGSHGVDAVTWTHRFQFKTSDGLFEFSGDHAQLCQGFLHLGFRRNTFQNHVFRLPTGHDCRCELIVRVQSLSFTLRRWD